MTRISRQTILALGILLAPVASFASVPSQLWVSYAPQATAVPALGGGFLLALGFLLVAIATRSLRAAKTGKLLSVILLGCGLAVVGIGVEKTYAALFYDLEIGVDHNSQCGDSMMFYHGMTGATRMINSCPEDVVVTGYNWTVGSNDQTPAPPGCPLDTSSCPVGTTVPSGGNCVLASCPQTQP